MDGADGAPTVCAPGEGEIRLGDCTPHTATPLRVPLDGSKGIISVEVTWSPNGEDGATQAKASPAEGSVAARGAGGEASAATAVASPPSQLTRIKMSLNQQLRASVPTIVPPRGKVGTASVVVLRASGLPAADTNGLSDPYVVVFSGGGKTKRTKVQKKTLAPVWAETLEVGVADAAEPLTLRVWDHDKFDTDDLLGAGTIALDQCPAGVRTPVEVTLEHTFFGGGGAGVVHVDVTWCPAEAPASAAGVPVKDKSA